MRKLLIPSVLIIIVALCGCEGPMGPQGLQGPTTAIEVQESWDHVITADEVKPLATLEVLITVEDERITTD